MSRVKMFGAIPRRPDVSVQYFHDHYRHPHGTLGRGISTMRAYVQSHQIHSDLLGPTQTHFEACAEVWFDCVQDAKDFPNEPIYVRDLIPDEPLFVDMDKLRFCFATEEILKSGPDIRDTVGDTQWRLDTRPLSVKLLQFVQTEGGDRWDQDNDLDLSNRIGAFRHVRCRPNPELHPDGAFVVGIRELWWPTQFDMEAGIAADQEAWRALFNRPKTHIAFVANAERFM
ncbi:MAG: EthD domain-containing protein [Caulobacterales bacterium]